LQVFELARIRVRWARRIAVKVVMKKQLSEVYLDFITWRVKL
jgi:hypothetical protein